MKTNITNVITNEVTNSTNSIEMSRTQESYSNQKTFVINPTSQDGVLASILAEKFSKTLVYCKRHNSWFYYEPSYQYWIPYEDSQVEGLIMDAIDESEEFKGKYSFYKVSGVRKLLKPKLMVMSLAEEDTSNFLPLKNGMLDLRTKQLQAHDPKYGLTYQLSYEFNSVATCQPIKDWLLESTGGDALQVEVLRAYLNAIIKSRTDLQRYLEIIGVGGSGKSTYVHLAEALVGLENTYSTNLAALEKNRFELGGIRGKKLVTINDSESYGGSVSVLKAITGQDSVRLEVKNKQQGDSFVPSAMILLTSNTSIRSSDYSSGLQRRRLTLHFNHAVSPDKMRNLISPRDGKWIGDFVPYLPGLLNWILEMSDTDVTRFVKETSRYVPTLASIQREAMRNSNPMAEWLDDNVVFVPNTKIYIGKKGSTADKYLYQNYLTHCESSGVMAVSLNRFSNSLIDICNHQLKQQVNKEKDREGVFIRGMRLRTKKDINIPTPITGQEFSNVPDGEEPTLVDLVEEKNL